VRNVILLEGINDIGGDHADANQLINADREIISRAHARGLHVFGGTLVPFGGSHEQFGGDYGTAWGEQQRQELNNWIRTGGAFDGVIDFDHVLADPAAPDRLDSRYDSGDHLHPSDAGYAAMAGAVELDPLLGPA
jgi:lysophospholipase L1-like esterase